MRGTFVIQPGSIVGCETNNNAHIVKAWIDGETVVAEDMATGFARHLSIYELKAYEPKKSTIGDLLELSPEKRLQAKERYKAIEPLVGMTSRKAVEERGKELEISPATLYRWINIFSETGVITSLVRATRSDKGDKKLTEKQEQFILEVIDEEYLTPERLAVTEIYETLKSKCKKARIDTPHITTLRNRIDDVDEARKTRERYGKRKAFDQFAPKAGKFPGASHPYSVIQIDHKRLDTIVVDDFNRIAIDRPWITVAIDVYSRIIAGYYLSLDHPNSLAVGMCLAMVILPKDKLFSVYSLEGKWPCFGLPTTVHVDNAKEFRSQALEFAADEYQFELAWRKVKRPEYGGHIESLLGSTFTNGLSRIPGRTFSNPVDRGEYDSAAKSVITLKELDRWMLDFVANTYNQAKHTQTLFPPIHQYTMGLLGSDEQPGPGRVKVPISGDRLLLDFLQIIWRPVHRAGIIIDRIWYYDEVLNRYINAPDPGNTKKKRKFIVRRDPRDISYVWFYDPDIKDYHKISYSNLSHPPMSLLEYKALRKWMEKQGIDATDEEVIFRSFERRKQLVADASKQTKKARREAQKAKHNKQPLPSHEAVAPKPPTSDGRAANAIQYEDVDLGDIEPFDEIEIY